MLKTVFLLFGFLVFTAVAAQKPESTEKIYDEQADARAVLASYQARAKAENRRLLLDFGANWCIWCRRLDNMFKTDPGVAELLINKYLVINIDVGKFDKNLDLASGYGADLKSMGVPVLVILDQDGKVLTVKNTGELEEGKAHSSEKVVEFLKKYASN
jgi:thiol:disulfide interchange protein